MSAVGVVLAGGRGRRMGGEKALVRLDGVALLHYPLRALAAVTRRQAVVAKAASVLPELPAGVERWVEPEEVHHPLSGVIHALRRAAGDPVLCCAVDLPLLNAFTLLSLLVAPADGSGCVVPKAGGRLQPLCALWRPQALAVLERLPAGVAMTEAVAAVDPCVVELADARVFTNVNAPEDLLRISRT